MKYVFKKSSFLEIGCGNGFMLEEAKLLGFRRVRGLEPSIDAISQAPKTVKKYIVNDILKEKTLSPSRFDLICLFQVFDHIPNPNEFLEICHKLLKPKGILVIMNHDVLSSSAKFLGERSPIFDIEHTYLYDKNTMRQILVNNHFRIRTIYSPQAIMTFRYIMRLLPLPKVVKRFFSNLKCPLIDWTVKFHPGNICAIAVKK
jgi:SAM-dependent methyltransferase